jgi:hypothetical protein
MINNSSQSIANHHSKSLGRGHTEAIPVDSSTATSFQLPLSVRQWQGTQMITTVGDKRYVDRANWLQEGTDDALKR